MTEEGILKWKKQILITIGILLVVASISTPTVLLLNRISDETMQERQQELRLDFIERYGPEVVLVEIVEPENLYIYIWEEAGMRHFTLSINGLFVELGSVKLEE